MTTTELAERIADYLATRTSRPTEPEAIEREAVYQTVRLMFTEALPETLEVLKRGRP